MKNNFDYLCSVTLCILRMGTLLPWNFFITPNAYWLEKLQMEPTTATVCVLSLIGHSDHVASDWLKLNCINRRDDLSIMELTLMEHLILIYQMFIKAFGIQQWHWLRWEQTLSCVF